MLHRGSPTKPSYHCLFQGPGSPLPRAIFAVVALPLLLVTLAFQWGLARVHSSQNGSLTPRLNWGSAGNRSSHNMHEIGH